MCHLFIKTDTKSMEGQTAVFSFLLKKGNGTRIKKTNMTILGFKMEKLMPKYITVRSQEKPRQTDNGEVLKY